MFKIIKKEIKNLNIISVDNLSKIYSNYNQRKLNKKYIINKKINMGSIDNFKNLRYSSKEIRKRLKKRNIDSKKTALLV